MAEQGAALQKYNQELVKHIEIIKIRRNQITTEIEQEETIKEDLEVKLKNLENQLDLINSNLKKKYEIKNKYDSAIKESEIAFMKILESSETLLGKVRRESEIIDDDLTCENLTI